MRPHQVFAAMAPEHARDVLKRVADAVPGAFLQAVAAACVVMKARPVYLQRQPFEKRADAVRRAMSRVTSQAAAEELLAVYFLECRKELLIEWLDTLGVAHEDGILEDDAPPPPDDDSLRKALEKFRSADPDPDRELLLRAYSAQTAIEWPLLDELVALPV